MRAHDLSVQLANLRERAASERRRAEQAAALAARHEAQSAIASEPLRSLHLTMASLQAGVEARHLSTAALHEMYALRLSGWLRDPHATSRPTLITAIAAALGTPSASLTFTGARGEGDAPVFATVSDATAKSAHDLEVVTAEGPSTDATATGALVRIEGAELWRRWHIFGPAVAELGVRAVVAAPLAASGDRLGALCAYLPSAAISDQVVAASRQVADALTHRVLPAQRVLAPHRARRDADPPSDLSLGQPDFPAVVYQAAGMIAVQCGFTIDIAQDMLRARAFADDVPIEHIAAGVASGELRLCEHRDEA